MLRLYGYAAGGQLAQALIALVSLAATTRVLGAESYGTFVVVSTVLTLLAIAVSAGPQAAVLILSARDAPGRRELHGLILSAGAGLAILTVAVGAIAAAPTASAIAPALEPAVMLVAFLRLPAVVYAGLVTSQLSGAGRIGLAALLNTIAALLSLLGPVGALVAPDRLEGAVIGTTIAAVLAAIVMGAAAFGASGASLPRGIAPWKAVAAIALPLHVGTIAYWVMLRADALAVNALLGPRSAGVYGLALGLSERVGLVTAPLYNATAWRISGPDRHAALMTTLRVARLEIAVGIVASVGALVLGRLVVTSIAGPEFADAALPLALLVFGAATLPIWSAVGLFLVSQLGGAWRTSIVQVVVAAAAVIGYWTVTPAVGIVGAALVSTGAYVSLVVIGVALIHRREHFALRELLPSPREIARGLRGVSSAIGRRRRRG